MIGSDQEIARLNNNGLMSLWPTNALIGTLVAKCNDPNDVDERVREALAAVLSGHLSTINDYDYWSTRLPKWFVEECRPALTRVEIMRARLDRSFHFKLASGPLDILGWLDTFAPEFKVWEWLGTEIIDSQTLHIHLSIDGWPYSSGPLNWLIRAAGASSVLHIEDVKR